MDKIYQTNDELIQYLNEHHNINLSDAKEYLEEFRFGSFYSPYKDLFATDLSRGKRIFSEELSTQDFVDIINLDLYLCIRLNNALGNFERRLKII